ncbi:MAG: inositol monophosphatase [Chlamydiales bacterium]|nr:inositol monophosphatase [Chlamydiia bacterium]MCP5507908.1 inositol monophosphatase [Chlamydiales bacterium]
MQNGAAVYLDTAKTAALAAGETLMGYWGKVREIREKSFAGDLVTEADNASEEVVIEQIRGRYPSHSIICEESGMHEIAGAEYLWAVDPLDGTTNYAHHHPLFCISIALLHHGKPIVGVVYNPVYKEMFHAVQGRGAFLNSEPITVSSCDELSRSLLATGFAYDRRDTDDNNYPEFCALTSRTHGVRRCGSAALDLAYVASGRLDGFWERGLNVWDIAAGIVLVEEAKGSISSYENGAIDLMSGRILASNGKIHAQMSKALQEAGLLRKSLPPL